MAYELSVINSRAERDAKGFVEESDAEFNHKISRAADAICKNMVKSKIVLLSGPSGSGKTTTATKLKEELTKRGIGTHTVSLDNYYKDRSRPDLPKTANGEVDLESPLCIDMELIARHFTEIGRGEVIRVPKYNFQNRQRLGETAMELSVGKDEIAVFEGIHALNDAITISHPEAFKLYISARSSIIDEGRSWFKGTWIRLVRRTLRDDLFRGALAEVTMGMWANVRRGEKMFISPFKNKADIMFDSSLPYEIPVMKPRAQELFSGVPDSVERAEEMRGVLPALERFAVIETSVVPENSLLREFIGGGIYDT